MQNSKCKSISLSAVEGQILKVAFKKKFQIPKLKRANWNLDF